MNYFGRCSTEHCWPKCWTLLCFFCYVNTSFLPNLNFYSYLCSFIDFIKYFYKIYAFFFLLSVSNFLLTRIYQKKFPFSYIIYIYICICILYYLDYYIILSYIIYIYIMVLYMFLIYCFHLNKFIRSWHNIFTYFRFGFFFLFYMLYTSYQ